MTKKYISFTFILLIALSLSAQNKDNKSQDGSTFSIDMSLRPRAEYRNGYKTLRAKDDKASAFINNRARVGINFDNGFLSARFAAQDVALWGEKKMTDGNGSKFTMNEAWAQITHDNMFVKVGRQGLMYDDGRLLSIADFNPTGKWHDVIKLGYENNNHILHLIFAYNQSKQLTNSGTYYEPTGQPYQNMQTMWYKFGKKRGPHASLMFINLGFETGTKLKPEKSYMQTLGGNVGYKGDSWNMVGTAYYQMGRNNKREAVSGHYLALNGKYNLNQVALRGGIEIHSAQKENSDKNTTIDLLYGGNHKFTGHMDYFSGGEPYGLFDKFVGADWKPLDKLLFSITYHHFSMMRKVELPDAGYSLSNEIDFSITYPIRPYIKLETGYSTMFGIKDALPFTLGLPLERAKARQEWGFISLTVEPELFRSKF